MGRTPCVGLKYCTCIIHTCYVNTYHYISVKRRLNQSQRVELGLIEQACDNPHEALSVTC